MEYRSRDEKVKGKTLNGFGDEIEAIEKHIQVFTEFVLQLEKQEVNEVQDRFKLSFTALYSDFLNKAWRVKTLVQKGDYSAANSLLRTQLQVMVYTAILVNNPEKVEELQSHINPDKEAGKSIFNENDDVLFQKVGLGHIYPEGSENTLYSILSRDVHGETLYQNYIPSAEMEEDSIENLHYNKYQRQKAETGLALLESNLESFARRCLRPLDVYEDSFHHFPEKYESFREEKDEVFSGLGPLSSVPKIEGRTDLESRVDKWR